MGDGCVDVSPGEPKLCLQLLADRQPVHLGHPHLTAPTPVQPEPGWSPRGQISGCVAVHTLWLGFSIKARNGSSLLGELAEIKLGEENVQWK